MDRDGGGTLSYPEFTLACRIIQYQGKIKTVWNQLLERARAHHQERTREGAEAIELGWSCERLCNSHVQASETRNTHSNSLRSSEFHIYEVPILNGSVKTGAVLPSAKHLLLSKVISIAVLSERVAAAFELPPDLGQVGARPLPLAHPPRRRGAGRAPCPLGRPQ